MTTTHAGVETKAEYTLGGILHFYRAFCEACDYKGVWHISTEMAGSSIRFHMKQAHPEENSGVQDIFWARSV